MGLRSRGGGSLSSEARDLRVFCQCLPGTERGVRPFQPRGPTTMTRARLIRPTLFRSLPVPVLGQGPVLVRGPVLVQGIVAIAMICLAPLLSAQAVAGKAPPGPGPVRKAPAGPPMLVRVTGPDQAHLTVSTVSPLGGGEIPAGLSGIALLDLDVSGRGAVTTVGAGGGRVVPLQVGQAVLLPGKSRDRVFLYRRTGTPVYGLFAATASAGVRVLIERNGIGPGASLSPFHPAIGVSPDGQSIAVAAASYSQGIGGLGDAWLIRVDGTPLPGASQSIVELTGVADDEVEGGSLFFAGGSLYAVAEERLVAAPADGSAGFTPLSLGLPPSWEVVEETLLSSDESTLFFLAGPSESQVDLYRLVLAGMTLQNVTQSPSAIEPPGYMPGTKTGPHLAVNADGSMVAYDIEIQNGHELYVRSVGPVTGPPLHVTPDLNFEHSIDDVSGLTAGGAKFRFFADSGTQDADLYEVSMLGGGAISLKNLTQTSGAPVPFFPNLATLDVHASPALGEARFVVDDRTGVAAGYDLWAVTASGLAGKLDTGLSEPPEFATNGTSSLSMTRGPLLHRLFRFGAEAPPFELLSVPSSIPMSSPALSRDGSVAAVAITSAGSDLLVRLDTETGALMPGSGSRYAGIHALSIDENERVLFSAAAGGGVGTFVLDAATGESKVVGAAAPIAFWIR